MPATITLLAFSGLLVWAAFRDLASYRIPNRVVAAMAALYPVHLLLDPSRFDPATLGVALVVFGLGFALYAAGKVGGGDVKLLAVVVLWAGAAATPGVLATMAIVGGIMSVLVVGRSRFLLARAAGAIGGERLRDGLIARELPYGVAIAAGGLVAVLPVLLTGAPASG